MKYVVSNKMVSIGGSSTIKDLEGNNRFFVKGKFFTFTKKKILKDDKGNVLFKIRNQFISWFFPKVFILDKDGNKLCRLRKTKLFTRDFAIETDKLKCEIRGQFFSLTSEILINDEVAAVVTREVKLKNLFVDSFVIDIINEEYTNFILALVIAIDNFSDKVLDTNS